MKTISEARGEIACMVYTTLKSEVGGFSLNITIQGKLPREKQGVMM